MIAPGAATALRRLDEAAGGLAIDVGLYAASAVFAGITGASATLLPHRAWGRIATIGYAVATVVTLVQAVARRRGAKRFTGTGGRGALTACVFTATALLPMIVEAVQRAGGRLDRAQEEVGVVEAGGARLWHTGTPYLGHQVIASLPAGQQLDAYLPYQPGMALFGLPRALGGAAWWTDARVWFALVFVATLVAAVRLVIRGGADRRHVVRAVQAATVFPIVALTVATGGDDLPVLGLCLLALALAARDRHGAAGVLIGVAGALKLFAWPVALVLVALAFTRGRAVGARSALAAIGIPVLTLVPAILVDRDAAVENVVRFPLGRGVVQSPAASPFPGHLIATLVPGGGVLATVLLVLAGIAIGGWLIRRPPRDAGQAALVCTCGMLAAILLIPSTRFGYLLYPVAYACWAPALRRPALLPALSSPAELRPAQPASAQPLSSADRRDPPGRASL